MKLSKFRIAKGRHRNEDESLKIDFSKSPTDILREILTTLISPSVSDQRKLSCYNVFVRFYFKECLQADTNLTKQQILVCLQSGLFSNLKELRAATLRALRYFCSDVETVQAFFSLHLQYFVVRSLDISLSNEVERTNALRLIRRIIAILLPSPGSTRCQSPTSPPPFSSSLPPTTSSSPLHATATGPPLQLSPQNDPSTTATLPNDYRSKYVHHPSLSIHYADQSSRLHGNVAVFSPSFVSLLNGVVAVANDGFVLKDKLFNVCLSTICELVIQEPFLASQVGGLLCLLRNIPQFHGHPRINEALVATILNVFNFPNTRSLIRVNLDLEQMLVPFTDLEYKVSLEMRDRFDVGSDVKYGACKLALGTILRSWSGVFYLCGNPSRGLQPLLSMLSLPDMETRKEILDVFYDIFRFSVPEWTDDFNSALKSIAALSKTMDTWKLVNGFIAEEAKSLLPHLSFSRLNLIDNHMSFTLRCIVDLGILEVVTKVIISSDKHVCVRATVLLGELLHLTSILLPESYNRHNHCLPQLIHSSMSSMRGNPSLRMQCSDALDCLLRIQTSKRIPPIESCNLFLQHQIISCFTAASIHSRCHGNQSATDVSSFEQPHWSTESAYQRRKKDSSAERESNESLPQILRDSQVLYTTDSKSWKWFDVLTIIKFPEDSLEVADETMAQRFLERLIQVFRPSGRIYSMSKISDETNHLMTLIVFHLVDHLVHSHVQAATTLLYSFLQDINSHLLKVIERSSISESLLNPSSLINTCSQMYFLVIGRLSSNKKGNQLLRTSKIYDSMSVIASSSLSSDIIIKLMISSMDYSNSSEARKILKEALSSTSESASQFCTSFLRILLRCHLPIFAQWCVPLLIQQMKNNSMAVATEALSVLMEAAEDEEHLRMIASQRWSLRHLGFKSDSLTSRFLSLPDVFSQLLGEGSVDEDMEKWRMHNNLEFVDVVEERLVESMTTYERTYSCDYARRTSRKYVRKDVLVPIHLYGQLVHHDKGVEHLRGQLYLNDYFEVVRRAGNCTKESLRSTKAALWIMGHIGSVESGFKILLEKNIIGDIIKVAETNPILTLRGTAFYVLGMLSSIELGRNELEKHGWIAVRVDKVDPFYVSQRTDRPAIPLSLMGKTFASLHSNVGFMTQISEASSEPPIHEPPTHDLPILPRMSGSTSGDRLNMKERRPSILSNLMNKLKSSKKSMMNSSKDRKVTKTSKSQTSSVSSDPCDKTLTESTADEFAPTASSIITCRRSSDVLPEDPSKPFFGSVQSSVSSTGKMSASVCSEEQNFSSSSVFLATEDKKKLSEEESRSVDKNIDITTSERAGSASVKVKQQVPGFLSDPDILLRTKNKPIQLTNLSLPVADVKERHKKTKSLDYRSTQKSTTFRHSLRDKIKIIKGTMKPHLNRDSTHKIHPGSSYRRPFDAPFISSNEMKLQRMTTHFISISLPLKMDQVFQSLRSQADNNISNISLRRNQSLNLRKEFFRHQVPEDKTSNKEAFNKLFNGLEDHRVDACVICSKMSSSSCPPTQLPFILPNEESEEGMMMIRKEVLRLMLQLSCTVGCKSTEQGLLIMKQRFPEHFRSLCLFSDVSHLLSTCSFRLESRRFVQELFMDLNFEECHKEAAQILGMTSPPTSSSNQGTASSSSSSPATNDEFKTAFSDFDYTLDRSTS